MANKKLFFKLQIVALLILVLALIFFIPKTAVYAETKAEQTKYNLADEINIPRKNQGAYSLCWAFASARSIETFLLINYEEIFDISESWASLAYYNYVRDENNSLTEDDIADYDYGDAGHFLNFENTINTYGVVSESDLPYGEDAFEAYKVLFTVDYDEAYEHYKDFATKDILSFKFDWIGYIKNENVEKTLEEVVGLAKIYLTTWGSIYSQVNMSNIKTNGVSRVINSTTGDSDHAISIVGWDDNYTYGDSTGAFIVMNSYGSSNEFFYVMYEDKHILGQARYIQSMTYNNKTIRVSLDYYDTEKIVTVIAIAGGTLFLMVVPPSIVFSIKKEKWKEI